jgi:hypothetical protein
MLVYSSTCLCFPPASACGHTGSDVSGSLSAGVRELALRSAWNLSVAHPVGGWVGGWVGT